MSIFVKEGRKEQLQAIITQLGANLRVGLFKAIAVVDDTCVLANITDCDFSGYAVATPAFSDAGFSANDNYQESAAAITFTHNGGGTANSVLGWYLYNTSTSKLHWFESFGAPVTLATNGQFITVTPLIFSGEVTPPL